MAERRSINDARRQELALRHQQYATISDDISSFDHNLLDEFTIRAVDQRLDRIDKRADPQAREIHHNEIGTRANSNPPEIARPSARAPPSVAASNTSPAVAT